MLGCNTALYDVDTNDWYWNKVNQKTATCYIKFGKEKFKYIHQIRPDNDDSIVTKDNEIITPRENFIPSATV